MLTFFLGLSPFRKLIASAAGFLVIFAIGFGAAEVYENKMPWGLKRQLVTAQGQSLDWERASKGWEANRLGWLTYAKALERARGAENDNAAKAVDSCSKDVDAQSHTAYENGYAAGKRVGLRQGASNANPSLPAGLRPSVGVRDPAAGPDPFFGGDRAYVPASPVSGRR